MPVAVNLKIRNMKKFERAFKKAPKSIAGHMNSAIRASIFEIEKHATPRNLRFKTARTSRTGLLRQSFKTGIKFGPLRGEIGPTVNYAEAVHEGHLQQVGRYVPAIGKRLVKPFIKANKYMPRIYKSAKPSIDKHFDNALEAGINKIARDTI